MELLWDDARRGTATNIEARTVIALFLRREGKYKEAIDVVRSLKQQYPRDYLFCLEEANLRKDAGEGMKAVEAYQQIVTDSARPGYFAQARLELAYFGMGDALRGQRHYAEAAHAYEQAAASKGVGTELKVRSLLSAGECHDVLNDRRQAVTDYQAAIAAGPNTSRADTARKRINSPYRGK
jgi:tetratricopeptide (TPR) repeat protein